jgi:ubiquinone/menaquinone biosynthesis C-methylase UbiE
MSLRNAYRLLAPVYDLFVARALDRPRARSLARVPRDGNLTVLIAGAGTGLDLPLLPRAHRYVALDLSRAMLTRARPRATALAMTFVEGDAQRMPFADASFDLAILHLIVAVVPRPESCLAEVARVLRPGGRALVFDKFLRRGQRAWLRRAVNPLARRIATRIDVVLEDVLASVPALALTDDRPALAAGWFRLIELEKEEETRG